MNGKAARYGILLELIWFVFAAILVFLALALFRRFISEEFYRFLFGTGFLLVTYFRFVIWGRHSFLLKSIWIKLLLFFGNIALFIFLLHYYNSYRGVFDEYNFTLPDDQFQHIRSGTDVDVVLRLMRLTVTFGFGSLVMIVLLELRLIWMIFRSRQLERLLKGSERK